MKKLIICLLLFGFISSGHSQILLKEAKVDYRPESMKLDPNSNSLVIVLPEKVSGEFQNNPLAFMKQNFDIQKFISDNKSNKYDTYLINFKSRKGYLAATIRNSGDLVTTRQMFKNVRLPESARLKVLEKYRDAAIVGNKYVAATKGWDLHKAHYTVKIKDGDKIKRLRIDADRGEYIVTSLD